MKEIKTVEDLIARVIKYRDQYSNWYAQPVERRCYCAGRHASYALVLCLLEELKDNMGISAQSSWFEEKNI